MEWLDKVYELVKNSNDKNYFTEKALDLVFENLDDLFRAGKFDEADKILNVVDLNQLDTNLLSGFMSATYPARDKLISRPDFMKRVRVKLTELVPKRVDAIMKGLDEKARDS